MQESRELLWSSAFIGIWTKPDTSSHEYSVILDGRHVYKHRFDPF